jgi:hypothetical protein
VCDGDVFSYRPVSFLFDAFEAAAFFGTDLALKGTEIFGNHTAAEFLGHGLVGGIFSVGQKGGFPAGFMAAGFSSLADSVDLNNIYANAVVHALAGGTGSILGGGKFANGAVTGALRYLTSPTEDSGEELQNGAAGDDPDVIDFSDSPLPGWNIDQIRQDKSTGLADAENKTWIQSRDHFATGILIIDQLLGIGYRENAFSGYYSSATKKFFYKFSSEASSAGNSVWVSIPEPLAGYRVFIIEHTHPYAWGLNNLAHGPSHRDGDVVHAVSGAWGVIHEENPNGSDNFIYF